MNKKLSFRAMRHAGFTLIEVMIAMLIGVIGIVVMMQTFAVSEGFKRTATSGTDAQINGSVALYMLEREVRLAGYGMNQFVPLGCASVRVHNTTAGTAVDMRMIPFEINPAGIPPGDANTDVLLINYGTADSFASGVQADQAGNSPLDPFTLFSNREGFRNGDVFVSIAPGAGPGGTASCVLHEVTAAPGAAGNCTAGPANPSTIEHKTSNYRSTKSACTFTPVRFNSATGIKDSGGTVVPPVRLATGGQVFNLGQVPSIKAYAIRAGNLTFCDLLVSDCANVANYQVMVNDIVSMRAVYGKDFNPAPSSLPGDGVVDTWDRVALADGFQASRVLAVMIEVTGRSGVKEKPSSGTVCNATTVATRPDKTQDWMGQAYVGIDLSTSSVDWQCYRYKLYQTSVPLRNLIWRP